MSTVRATTHTASPGDSAAAPAAGAIPLVTPQTRAMSRSDVGRSGKAAAVIARLPDVSTANEKATLADSAVRSSGAAGSPNPMSTAKQWLNRRLRQRWTDIAVRWRRRSPMPRDRRRAAIVGGSVACGLGLVAIALLVAPRLGNVFTRDGANQPPIADSSWKSFSVETPMLPPVGPSNVAPGAQKQPVAATDTNYAYTDHVHVSAAPLWTPPADSATGNDNFTSSTPAELFPNLPDRGGTSPNTATAQMSIPNASTPYTSMPATTGPQMTAPASRDSAVAVSNQPQGLTSPDRAAARQSSGSEVFTWRRDEAAAQQPSGSYAPAQPSAATGPSSFRAPQAMLPTGRAEGPVAQYGRLPNTNVIDGYRSGYHAAPMPSANATATQGLTPEDTEPMERRFPTTAMAWSNQRRQWAASGARLPPASQQPNTTQPYHTQPQYGYGPGSDAAPYAAGPPNYPAIAGQDANVGQQPQVQSFRR